MLPIYACPTNLIDDFIAGEISPDAQRELEQHLTQCEQCEDTLTRRTADPQFWNDAKTFLSSDVAHDQSSPASVRDDLEHVLSMILGPTDDPRMMGRFGGYEICGVIGRGGMGLVLKGLDVSLDRFVAIKVLDPSYAGSSAARQRFIREAQAAAAVVHDNVIAIYGVDHSHRFPFLVMPYVKGESLEQRIVRLAPLPIEDVLQIGMQIASGLAAAHDQGLVHRDIKPGNILMPATVSRVIITDFGLARAADDASLTCSGVVAGTPLYMSPQQVAGEPVDGRTDLFSLGSVIYAMVCGHPPFRAETPYGIMRRITDQTHRPLSQVQSSTPVWLERIVDRLLQKDPSKRFGSAVEVATLLEDCLAHVRQPTTVMLPKITAVRKTIRWKQLWLISGLVLMATLIGATISVVGLSAGWWLTPKPESQPTATTNRLETNDFETIVDDSDLLQLESDLEQLWQDVNAGPF